MRTPRYMNIVYILTHLYFFCTDTFIFQAWSNIVYQSNLLIQSPLLGSHLYLKVTFSCPVIENFIWNEPLLRGHLSYKVTFSLSQSWPLNTGLTVLCMSLDFQCHMLWSFLLTMVWDKRWCSGLLTSTFTGTWNFSCYHLKDCTIRLHKFSLVKKIMLQCKKNTVKPSKTNSE
jgi:hypothetical protein